MNWNEMDVTNRDKTKQNIDSTWRLTGSLKETIQNKTKQNIKGFNEYVLKWLLREVVYWNVLGRIGMYWIDIVLLNWIDQIGVVKKKT